MVVQLDKQAVLCSDLRSSTEHTPIRFVKAASLLKGEEERIKLVNGLKEFMEVIKEQRENIQKLEGKLDLVDSSIRQSAAEEKDKKIKQLEENLAAVNFTTQSRMGKLLMAKCRTLQEENDEIGMMASEGKIHELGMKLKLQKNQNLELRRQIQELLDYMEMLVEGVDKSNELVNIMKKQLKDKDIEAKKMTEGKKPKIGGKEDKKISEG